MSMYLPKRYTAGLATLSLAAASLTLGLSAQAADPVIPENLYGVVKLPPLQTLTSNVMSVARKVEPGPQTELLPMLMLGGFGYPSFPGVSTTDGITAFILKGQDDSDVQVVIYAKIEDGSQTRQALVSPEMNIKVQDRDGWTLLSQSEDAFAAVKDHAALAALAAEPTEFGVEARLYVTPATKSALNKLIDEEVAEKVDEGDAETLAKVKAWKDFGFKLLDHNLWAGFGISANADTLSVGALFAPRAGSPDAAWAAAPLPAGRVDLAQVLPASGWMNYTGQFNVPATLVYLKALEPIAAQVPDKKVSALLGDAIAKYAEFTALHGGKFAGSASEINIETGKVGQLSIVGGSFKQADVDAFYKYAFDKLVPEFIAIAADAVGVEKAELEKFMKMGVKTDVKQIDGQSVGALSVVAIDPTNPENTQTTETYYAVANGNLLSSDSLESLEGLIKAVVAGKPVANNLADALPLSEGLIFNGKIDLKGIFAQVSKNLTGDIDQSDLEAVKALEKLDLKPVDLALKSKNGLLIYRADASVDSLITLYRTFEAFNAADQVEGIEVQTIEVQAPAAN